LAVCHTPPISEDSVAYRVAPAGRLLTVAEVAVVDPELKRLEEPVPVVPIANM
jgi:hypothetical protein